VKRFWLRVATCLGVLALGLVVVPTAANAGAAGPSILVHIGALDSSKDVWKSTASHTVGYDYQACVATYGYDETSSGMGDGWNISYRYSSNHKSFWTGPSYHHDISSYCGPWKNVKGSVYTRVTARYDSYLREADVWQYWN